MVKNEHEIKLVALDMDGTLLNDQNEVSEFTKEVIAKAVAQDVQVVLSTGRPLRLTYPFAEILQLNSYLITVNGGEVWTASKELLERHLHDVALIKEMWQLGTGVGVNTWMASTERSYNGGARPEDFAAHEWLKIGFNSEDQTKLDEVLKGLSRYDEKLEITNSLPTNIEVNPAGVNKAKALKRVCSEIGITMNEVMAVGDSLNDRKMIEQAGIGVAVDNAQEIIKETAYFVTDSNNNDGVAKAIERFVL